MSASDNGCLWRMCVDGWMGVIVQKLKMKCESDERYGKENEGRR